ncbi:DUF4347 domain-containing protein, partial [Desulfoplanes sp.]
MSFFSLFASKKDKENQHTETTPLVASKLLMPLEPRFLYDAAGLAVGIEGLDQADQDHDQVDSLADDHANTSDNIHHLAQENDHLVLTDLAPPAVEQADELVFVDPSVKDYQSLVANISSDARVIVLDPTRDGLTQVSEFLAQNGETSAIHILSHGDAHTLNLAGTTLTPDNLADYQQTLSDWQANLGLEADILIYGCDIAADEAGQNMIAEIARLTGADVAASDDPTGSESLGGDWDLEQEVGQIDGSDVDDALAQSGYEGLLAAPSVTSPGNLTTNEDVSASLSGFEVTSPSNDNMQITATLT